MRRSVTTNGLAALERQLSERDWQILRYVSDLRFVSGRQIARLCFPDAGDMASRQARQACLRLTRLDVLARLPRPVGGARAGSAGYVYYVGLVGQRLAIRRRWKPAHRVRRPREPGTLFQAHTLLVAELHVLIREADRTDRLELLQLAGEPSCHRIYRGVNGQQKLLKPDSYLRVGAGAFEDSYFVEVDRGSEGSWAIAQQLGRYIAAREGGLEQGEHGAFPRVVWLTERPERVAAIEECVAKLRIDEQPLFVVLAFEDAVRYFAETARAPP